MYTSFSISWIVRIVVLFSLINLSRAHGTKTNLTGSHEEISERKDHGFIRPKNDVDETDENSEYFESQEAYSSSTKNSAPNTRIPEKKLSDDISGETGKTSRGDNELQAMMNETRMIGGVKRKKRCIFELLAAASAAIAMHSAMELRRRWPKLDGQEGAAMELFPDIPKSYQEDPGLEFGTIVIDGRPKYKIWNAIKVNQTWRKIIFGGIMAVEFVHPLTREKIVVPWQGGKEYVDSETGRVYIIYVDTSGRTILIFKGFETEILKEFSENNSSNSRASVYLIIRKYQAMCRKKNWGSMVIGGIPEYDIPNSIFIMETQKKIDSEGIMVIQFIHPVTAQIIQIPVDGSDEYLLPHKSQVFNIFVDHRGQTLLIFKEKLSPAPTTDGISPGQHYVQDSINASRFIDMYKKIATENNWGSLVIGGIPEYDLSNPIIIMEARKKIDENGMLMLEFVHPLSGQTVWVPLLGGDEYVVPETSREYIIFVDVEGRTLLIYKGGDRSISPIRTPGEISEIVEGRGNMDPGFVLEKYAIMSREKNWGQLVVGRLPKYDTKDAIFVMESESKIGAWGIPMLEFFHPITGQTIQVPSIGGDEYVKADTHQVFVIFIDSEGRTLLILKRANPSQAPSDYDSQLAIEIYRKISDQKNWGSLVIGGVPGYDTSSAIIVMDTKRKIGEAGIPMIEFIHPTSGQEIRVPIEGGDEYVLPNMSQVFIIFVDVNGQTLLIFKGIDRSASSIQSSEGIPEFGTEHTNTNLSFVLQKYAAICREKNWGSLVVGGLPEHNISQGILVTEVRRKIGEFGIPMIEFVNPNTGQTIRVPVEGGDEYSRTETQQVFLIFVDVLGETILIFKEMITPTTTIATTPSQEEYLGSIVLNDQPPYDFTHSIHVTETSKVMGEDGKIMIEFEHPIIHRKIRIPNLEGHEWLLPDWKVVHLFVDFENRTLVIYKGSVAPPEGAGMIALYGYPKWDVSNPIYVMETKFTMNRDFIAVLEFVHPLTGQTVEVPLLWADEYVKPGTLETFIIFVDSQSRTLLLYKGSFEQSGGSVVIGGHPKYDMLHAYWITSAKRGFNSKNLFMSHFLNPFTNQRMQVPYNGGEEYAKPGTLESFIIFVDGEGRTLMIYKGSLEKTNQAGSIVIDKIPGYDLQNAIFVLDTHVRWGIFYPPVIDVVHPITGVSFAIPLNGGDEYLEPATLRVFLIFVDNESRTLLFYKGAVRQTPEIGSIVIAQMPQYDLSNAIYVREVVHKSNDDLIRVIACVHPITNQTFEVPEDGGDEYMEPGTLHVFIIYVDSEKRTLLIYQREAGSIVVGGLPIYDITRALFVMEPEKKIGPDGLSVLEFPHPVTGVILQVAYDGGEEYVEAENGRVFVIFVDSKFRTILIFKGNTSDLNKQNNTIDSNTNGSPNANRNANFNTNL